MLSNFLSLLPLSSITFATNPLLAERGGSSNTPLYPHRDLCKYAPCIVSREWRRNLNSSSTIGNKLFNSRGSSLEPISKDIDIAVDYLMGIIHIVDFYSLVSYIEGVFNTTFVIKEGKKEHGCYTFYRTFFDPLSGLKIFHKYDDEIDLHTAALIIPGTPCRQLSKSQILELIVRLDIVYNFSFTCIDVFIDDRKKRASFKKLYHLARSGDVAGTSVYKYIAGGVSGDWGVDEADTIYFGSKRCGLKVYNSDFLHDTNAFRWEGRFRDYRAKTIVRYITDMYDDLDVEQSMLDIYRYLGNKVLNITKFIKRNGDRKQSISRFKKYRFYSSLLKSVGELDPEVLKEPPKPNKCAEEFIIDTFFWFNRQIFKRMAMMQASLGDQFQSIFDICLQASKSRYTRADIAICNKLQSFVSGLSSRSFPNIFYDSLMPG